MRGPFYRIGFFQAKTNELIDIQGGIIFGTERVCPLKGTCSPTIMTYGMGDALVNIC
jgi:hypothetical protein